MTLPALAEPRGVSAVPRRASVLHLIHTMAYGGVETVLINWLQAMDTSRFDVHLACFANPGGTEQPFVDAAERAGLVVRRIPWGRHKPIWKASRALARMIRDLDVDILHTHNCYADVVGAVAARIAPVTTTTTLYVWADFNWKRNLLQAVDRWAIRCFDDVTAHCEFTRRETIARGIPAQRIKTLACGFAAKPFAISPGERRRRRREAGVNEDQILLVNVARLYPEKSHDFLLRCFRDIHRRHPQARLWIAGVGPLEATLRASCRELGLDSVVRFIGFASDLASVLSLADIQVHPAAVEGVPLAVCEGMAMQLPIVASEVGGIPEVLRHGENGLLVPPGAQDAFVEAVCRLIEKPDEAALLAQRARRFIETEFSLTSAVQRVEQHYLGLLRQCASASLS